MFKLANNLPTEVKHNSMFIFSWISCCTIRRVQRPKSKPYCRGSLPKIQRLTCCFCFSLILGVGPWETDSAKASHPFSLNSRSHGKIVVRHNPMLTLQRHFPLALPAELL